jgi:hypothetical protein
VGGCILRRSVETVRGWGVVTAAVVTKVANIQTELIINDATKSTGCVTPKPWRSSRRRIRAPTTAITVPLRFKGDARPAREDRSRARFRFFAPTQPPAFQEREKRLKTKHAPLFRQ